MKKQPRIYLSRDSACLGDDFSAPHEKEWIQKPDNDLLLVMNRCKANYLPSNIQGNNPGWIAKNGANIIAVIAQHWDESKLIPPYTTTDILKDKNGNIYIHFEYLQGENPDVIYANLLANA